MTLNTSLLASQITTCPYCQSPDIIKKGKRKNKLQTLQLWFCRACQRVFTSQKTRGLTYPLPVVLAGISYYNTGLSLRASCLRLKSDFGLSVPTTTLSSWLTSYGALCTYRRIRNQIRQDFSPSQVIKTTSLYHRQVYNFRIHEGKLKALAQTRSAGRVAQPLTDFLHEVFTNCPNELFDHNHRASQLSARFNMTEAQIRHKANTANRIAGLVLQTVSRNIDRHESIQKFMLTNDSVTVATEVPIYLMPSDVDHLQNKLGFSIPLQIDEPITGHVDFLQIRDGMVHILDYKPKAKSERPFQQLMLYALALSRLTGLRLYDFKCAWFDENDYYEFYPLHVVHRYKPKAPSASAS